LIKKGENNLKKKNITVQLNNGILDSQKSDDLFMYMEFPIVTDCPNLNGYHFNSDFIDSVVELQEKYIGSPLVVDIDTLLAYDFESLGHKYSSHTGVFNTVEIGSFYKFEKRFNEDGLSELVGYAKVSKRNYDLCEAIVQLHNSDTGLNISVEVVAQEYKVDGDTLIIGASDKNYLSGIAIVSFPANPDAKVLTLVAQYLGKGSNEMKKNIFAELSHDDIRCQISGLINTEKDRDGYLEWNYWVSAIYNEYVIYNLFSDPTNAYYKVAYSVSSDNVVSLSGEPEKVEINYTILNSEGGKDMENDVKQLIAENATIALENKTLKEDFETLKSEVAALATAKETITSEKAEVEVKLNEANEAVVSLGKEKEILAEKVETFSSAEAERLEKDSVIQIEAMLEEVKADLTEEEVTIINEIADTKDVKAVQFKLNEIIACHYRATLKLNNSKDTNFFAMAKNEAPDNDTLANYNM